MSTPILATKLHIPAPRRQVVSRPRLIARLNEGLHHKLTLISAPAGFGKTTLVSEWIADCQHPAAWLSLDAGDKDPTRFLICLIAALQTLAAHIGAGALRACQSPQPPPPEAILTVLLNEIATMPDDFILVMDDYHSIDAPTVDLALTFLLDHLPPQMRLVIATREDPRLPLARLRARDHLTELRAADLRFTAAEATEFLNQVMGLNLSAPDIAALATRTEGWIAGLQLASLSMQGHPGDTNFISSFTGSHHFVTDYLVEEVLQQQSASIQAFLLRTALLDRLCGPLCDAMLGDSAATGQATLEWIERANLFIVPLDDERRWYRYHHLFADLLRQRLRQTTSAEDKAELHRRASAWYEAHGLEIEAFHHAAAAHDVETAARLIEGKEMPLHFRGAAGPILQWLATQPRTVLDARPALWVIYASVLLFVSQTTEVEPKLHAAEAALQRVEPNDTNRDLIGHIASIRATLAVSQQQAEAIIVQSRRALEYLHPANLPVRTATTWTLGYAYQLHGERAAARQVYTQALTISQAIGHGMITLLATIGLGYVQEVDTQLHLAVQTYQQALQLAGDPPQSVACEAHLGLARIFYEWDDLAAAQHHAQQSLQLAQQIATTDRFVASEVMLARLKRTRGDMAGASTLLAQAAQLARQQHFVQQMPQIAAAQALLLLRQGNVVAAAQLAQTYDLPVSQARVHMAKGDMVTALATLATWRQQVEAKDWVDERLKVLALQALAFSALGKKAKAMQLLGDALALAEPPGIIRTFVDEGPSMAHLLTEASVQGMLPDYGRTLLAAYAAEQQQSAPTSHPLPLAQALIEPLSQRELEVLQLIAQGLSNHEISERLFLALSTVKGHNQKIFEKLAVRRRTEAVAHARTLGLL